MGKLLESGTNCRLSGEDVQLNTSIFDKAVRDVKAFGEKLNQHAHAYIWPGNPLPQCIVTDPTLFTGYTRGFAWIINGAKSCDVLNEVLAKTPTYAGLGINAFRDASLIEATLGAMLNL